MKIDPHTLIDLGVRGLTIRFKEIYEGDTLGSSVIGYAYRAKCYLYEDWVNHRDWIYYKARGHTPEMALEKLIAKIRSGKHSEKPGPHL